MRYIFAVLLLLLLPSCTAQEQPEDSYIPEVETKLYIDDREIPVTWENNSAVGELKQDISENDITVDMFMYSNNEQVGSLGKSYSSDDKNITTQCGDIVLYSSDNIVVFYAPNTWAYTPLGKIQLPDEDVVSLLSDGDVDLRLTQ